MKRVPQRDPIGSDRRRRVAQRRVGEGAQCACGESRPEALVRTQKDVRCAACARAKQGKSASDRHHVAGVSNSPVTVSVPVNDHRAELTPAQQDWPPTTLANPERSPLLAAAAMLRGVADTIVYLIKAGVRWVIEMLELLDVNLRARCGAGWWHNTEVARYAPQ